MPHGPVNEVTLFRHFGSKQVLYQAVLDEVTGRIKPTQDLFAQIADQPPRQALLEIARLRLSFFEALRLTGYFGTLQEQGLFRRDRSATLAAEAFTAGLWRSSCKGWRRGR